MIARKNLLYFKPNQAIYHEELAITVHQYRGYVPKELFIRRSMEAVELMKTHHCDKLFVDLTNMEVMPLENQQWIQNHWFLAACQAGVKKIVFIVPNSLFGQISVENSNKNARNFPLETMYFSDRSQALDWLLEDSPTRSDME